MDRFEAMSIALAVAETGSLSAAARYRKTPLATVSRRISELEALLQTKLFNRTTRELVPTEAGRSFVAAAKRILADVAEAERTAAGASTTPRGKLTLAAPITLGRLHLMPVLAQFLATFREVDVQLDLLDRQVNLLGEEVDVALRINPLPDSSLIGLQVGEIRRVLCASPAYLKSKGVPKTPDDLAKHDCITYPPLQLAQEWVFTRNDIEYVVPVRSRLIVNNIESACEAARGGVGITSAFSYQVGELIKSGELTPLLRDFMPPSRPVTFVYSPNRFMPVKLRVFLDFVAPRLRARLRDLSQTAVPPGPGEDIPTA